MKVICYNNKTTGGKILDSLTHGKIYDVIQQYEDGVLFNIFKYDLEGNQLEDNDTIRLVIIKATEIPNEKIQQSFRDGEVHCVIEPLYNLWKMMAEKSANIQENKLIFVRQTLLTVEGTSLALAYAKPLSLGGFRGRRIRICNQISPIVQSNCGTNAGPLVENSIFTLYYRSAPLSNRPNLTSDSDSSTPKTY